MRVSCDTVEDFLANLSDVRSDDVILKTLYLGVNRRYRGADRKEDCLIVEHTIQLSAVVRLDDGTEYLLVAGEGCGLDHLDTEERDGSRRLESLRERINDYCIESGLRVKPGVVSE